MMQTEGKETTLTVFRNGTPIFTSFGKWLYPLFELEDYLAEHAFQPENLILQDKIIKKSAPMLAEIYNGPRKLDYGIS
jgi:hypothetical protein